jgi:hypothetical protein
MAICAWLLCIGMAAVPMVRHQLTAGLATDAGRWPSATALRPFPTGITVVLAVHARCPCAWASLDELSQALTAAPDLQAYVLVGTPPGTDPDEALARRARRLPRTQVVCDDGSAAHAFGVSTSGHALAFDRLGGLRFSGGITGSRGHRGDNAGMAAVIALGRGAPPGHAATPVYGCPLGGPDQTCSRCAARRPE